jgi:hypothetical protein
MLFTQPVVPTIDFAFDPTKHSRGHTGQFVKHFPSSFIIPKADPLLMETAKSFFRAQSRSVIGYLSNLDHIPSSIPDFSFIAINYQFRFNRILEKRSLDAASSIGEVTPILHKKITKQVDAQVKKMFRVVNRTTAKRMRDALKLFKFNQKQGTIRGNPKAAFIKSIREVFDNAIALRVPMIGEAETLRAISAGENAIAITKATKKLWVCRDKCCDHCLKLSKIGWITIDKPFAKTKYGVVNYSPLHVNCRCYVKYK